MIIYVTIYTLGKIYSSASEEAERRLVFEDNLDYINQHNQEYMHGKSSFYLGVNEYTDLVRIFS